ncbi:outer membrane beta-barrel protein [Microbulbifer sp. JSM ZJ756]|uniref:outer membrane beta-barrel protein n=1 Tax=Microbulbifer sp. JSM ZJ756 TaxID=3376191 RepID=UPI00379BE2D8
MDSPLYHPDFLARRLLLALVCTLLPAIGYASGAPTAPPADAEQVFVESPYVNIYTGPGRGYPIFHVAEHGEPLWLLKRRTDWVKVATRKNIRGWTRIADLAEIRDAGGEPVRIPLPDYSDYRSQRFNLGFTYGDFEGANAMGVSLGYRFTANLSGELRATQAVGEFSDSQTYQVAVLHQPFPQWRVSPYFMLGTGINITSPNATIVATEDRQDTAMLTGFGLRTHLSRQFALRAEVANHYLLTSRESNQEIYEWKLGFDVFL